MLRLVQMEALMKKLPVLFLLVIGLTFLIPPKVKATPALNQDIIQIDYATGLGFRYLQRTLTWDDAEQTSPLKASILTAQFAFSTDFGVTLTPFIGLVFQSFDNLVFRQLPLSVELETGNISGWIFGGDLTWEAIEYANFSVGLKGEFLYSLGNTNNWSIPGLMVEGKLQGKPNWWEARLGPLCFYQGWDTFTPFIWTGISPLQGTFSLEETIETLHRTEDKEIKGKGNFFVSLGTNLNFSPLRMRVCLDLFPSKDNLDPGVTIQIFYVF